MANYNKKLIKLYTWRNTEKHPPYNLLYLASSLRRAKFNVSIGSFDTKDSVKENLKEIIKEKPFLVGISLVSSSEIVASSLEFAKLINRYSHSKVILGGPHAASYAADVLKYDFIDYVCLGNGEEMIYRLAKFILNKKDYQLADINNLAYREKENIFLNPIEQIFNLDQYKLPWNLIKPEDYVQTKEDRIIFSIITSRGCPHNCGFCFNAFFNKRKWVSHSSEYVVDIINFIKERYCITHVKIVDDNFFTDMKRAYNILKSCDVKFAFPIRANEINKHNIDIISKKCYTLMVGFESGSERILNNIIQKGISIEDNKKAISLLSKYPQISIFGSILLGLPTETKDDIEDTKNFIRYAIKKKKEIEFSLCQYLPFPNTPLSEKGLFSFNSARGFTDFFKINHNNIYLLDKIVDNFINKKI